MKVLVRGTPPPPLTSPKTTICYRCNSVLEYTISDTKPGQYGGSIIECPVCKQFLDV